MDGIIPVIDLKQGQVVHAIAGDRKNYQPIKSVLTDGSVPSAIASTFRDQGFETVYVADLDAITGDGDNASAYRGIRDAGLEIWVDRGITDGQSALDCVRSGISQIVVGLESIDRTEQISEILQAVDSSNAIVSLDMQNGNLLTRHAAWKTRSPSHVAAQLIGLGVQSLILLDLSRVGMGQGTGTEILCQEIKRGCPAVRITVGGGVASRDDVTRLLDIGADNVLVSTALHRGKIC